MKIICNTKLWCGKTEDFQWKSMKGAGLCIEPDKPARRNGPPGRAAGRLKCLDGGRQAAFVARGLVLVNDFLVGDAVDGAH